MRFKHVSFTFLTLLFIISFSSWDLPDNLHITCYSSTMQLCCDNVKTMSPSEYSITNAAMGNRNPTTLDQLSLLLFLPTFRMLLLPFLLFPSAFSQLLHGSFTRPTDFVIAPFSFETVVINSENT